MINPFPSPACKISGLKDVRLHLKNSIFFVTSPFSVMHFDKNILQGQCEKENKKAEGLQILHFYWTFALTFFAAVYLN